MIYLLLITSLGAFGPAIAEKVACARLKGTTWITAQDQHWAAIVVDFVKDANDIAKINNLHNRKYTCTDEATGARVVIHRANDEQLIIHWKEPQSDTPSFALQRTVMAVHGSMKKPVVGNAIEVEKVEQHVPKVHLAKVHSSNVIPHGKDRHKTKKPKSPHTKAASETTPKATTKTSATPAPTLAPAPAKNM